MFGNKKIHGVVSYSMEIDNSERRNPMITAKEARTIGSNAIGKNKYEENLKKMEELIREKATQSHSATMSVNTELEAEALVKAFREAGFNIYSKADLYARDYKIHCSWY